MFDEEAHIAAHRIEKGSAKTVQDVMARFEDFMNASYGPEFIEDELGLPIVGWVDPISVEAYSAALSLHPGVTVPGELRALYTVHGTPNIDGELVIYPAEQVLVSRGSARSPRWEEAFSEAPIPFNHAKTIDETYVLAGLLDVDAWCMFLLFDRAGGGFATMLIAEDEIFLEEKETLATLEKPRTPLSLPDALAKMVNELIEHRTSMFSDEFHAANPDAG